MGKKRGYRDLIIIVVAIIGTILIIFQNANIFFLPVGIIMLIVALGISLSRWLIK